MNAREEAIADCKYARSLGVLALDSHFEIWQKGDADTDEHEEYQLTILEIQRKLNTNECLLEV